MFRNRNIRDKLISGFVVVAIMTGVVGAVGFWGLYTLSSNETKLHTMGVNTNYVYRARVNIEEQQTLYREAIIHFDDTGKLLEASGELELLDKEFDEIITFLEQNVVLESSQNYAELIHQTYLEQFLPVRELLVEAANARDLERSLEYIAQIDAPAELLSTYIDSFVEAAEAESAKTNASDNRLAMVLRIVLVAVAVLAAAVAVWLGIAIARSISRRVNKMVRAAERLAVGDIQVDVSTDSKDEIGVLADAFQHMVNAIQEQADVLKIIAEGNFVAKANVRSDRDVINHAINALIESSNSMISEVRNASDQVSSGAQQIAQGAQNLASGSSEQAASIQQFSTTLGEILEQTENNAQSAQKAVEVTVMAGDLMNQSVQSMGRMMSSMESIDESSRNMAKIIKVIEDIAFQTNILSLNAAVEAARAGQHGKGFAVVADEVRNLASKSASAAKETSALIESSVRRVSEGNEIVKTTNTSLSSMAEYSAQSLSLIHQISESCASQSASISEISQGVEQISHVVQSNSATAEESAAAAQEMSAQAGLLRDIVGRFKLRRQAAEEGAYMADGPELPLPLQDMQDSGFALSHDKY